MVLNNFIKAACLSTCLGLASGSILANNYTVDTNGGLKVYDNADNNHWFNLSGKMQVDLNFQHGNGQNATSALSLRGLQTDVRGGIGQDTSYSFRMNGSEFQRAQLSYSGFNSWSRVSLGQVSMPFGADSQSSFLEDNLVQATFQPQAGNLGVAVDLWNDKMGLRFAVNQHGNNIEARTLNTSARLSFAPVNRDNLVVHLGLSGYYQQEPTHAGFSASLTRGGQNLTASTQTAEGSSTCVGLDAAVLRGPVFLQAGFTRANFGAGTLQHAQGWNVEGSYALTGETRSYDYRNGSFSGLRTNGDSGSWEVSVRHSNLNVNSTNFRTFGASVGWSVNSNLRLLANYMNTPQGNNAMAGALTLRVQAAW